MKESIRRIEQLAPDHIVLLEKAIVDPGVLKQHDLLLISIESWKKMVDSKSIWLKNVPYMLIMRDMKS